MYTVQKYWKTETLHEPKIDKKMNNEGTDKPVGFTVLLTGDCGWEQTRTVKPCPTFSAACLDHSLFSYKLFIPVPLKTE